MILAFVDDSTVRAFENVQQAHVDCELIDVQNGLYTFLDEQGFVLTPRIETLKRKLFGLILVSDDTGFELQPTKQRRDDLLRALESGEIKLEPGASPIRTLAELRQAAPRLFEPVTSSAEAPPAAIQFTPDDKIQKIAEAYALDACDFLRDQFRVMLDWSDDSIRHIEAVMDTFHRESARARPPTDKVMGFAKMFGSYIGEVYRRNHGATWGMVEMNGQKFPGLKSNSNNTTFWPWGRAQKRLLDGPENNVWHYYSGLIEQPAKSS